MNPRARRANKPQSRLEDATGGKPFGECSREELLEACRWFWMARDEARAGLAADRAREPDLTSEEARQLVLHDELKGDEMLERIDWPLLDAAHAKLRAFLASGDADEGSA